MITFDFAALNFTNSILNQYAYRLEGFDDHWIYCGNRQSATFTNLDGGTYTFHVKAANNDGVWNEQGAKVLITVNPPFWKTWWFYLLCAAIISWHPVWCLSFSHPATVASATNASANFAGSP